MALNFSNEKLVKITCDKVFNDFHDVQNLISNCPETRNKGFLVEYYIRPPVMITIELTLHSLNLMYLEIGLQLRQHQCNGIEVYTLNSNENNVHQDCHLIAKYRGNNSKLRIINNCYTPSRHLPPVNNSFSNPLYISGRNLRFCNNIKFIKIKIFSTLNSSVPCLSYLDIYGKPVGIYNEDLKCLLAFISNAPETIEPNLDTKYKNIEQLEGIAPIEFFDTITNELMSMPFLLPSGKNIDKSTLDKYLNTNVSPEQQVDPFTRLPFTEQSKPILNVELKTRIDLFKDSNGESEIKEREELRKRLLNFK